MSTQFFFNDLEKIADMCYSLELKYQWECIRTASSGLILYKDPKLGRDLCYVVNEDLLDQCLTNWDDIMKQHDTI